MDFEGSTRLYEREGTRIAWSENVFDPEFDAGAGATDFERNLIRFRAEARNGFAVLRPAGIVEFATVSGS